MPVRRVGRRSGPSIVALGAPTGDTNVDLIGREVDVVFQGPAELVDELGVVVDHGAAP